MIWLILGAAAIAAFALGGLLASCELGAQEDERSGWK